MKKIISHLLIYSSTLFLMSACGFAPLYGSHGSTQSVAADLANVHVGVIPDAPGQQLRNNILDLMPPSNPNPRYVLNVLQSETSIGVAIATDATVTREQLRNNVHAELYDTQTQKVVWRQDMAETSGYNVLSSQYSNLVGSEDARTRNLQALADRVVNLLSLYFNRQAP
jgi:LPS-assembly lipoprotein